MAVTAALRAADEDKISEVDNDEVLDYNDNYGCDSPLPSSFSTTFFCKSLKNTQKVALAEIVFFFQSSLGILKFYL